MEIQKNQTSSLKETKSSNYLVKEVSLTLLKGMSLVTSYPVEGARMVMWSESLLTQFPDLSNIELAQVFESIMSGDIDMDRSSGVLGVMSAVKEHRKEQKKKEFLNDTTNEYHPDNFFNNFG